MNKWPHFSDREIRAVEAVLRSGYVNYWTGKEGKDFEKEFSRFCKTAYSVALTNGSLALELALHSLHIEPGGEVIVTPRSFIASASSIVNTGHTPVFTDVDPESQNITASTIEPLITKHTRAIMAVHLAGWPCDMDPILELANQHGLYVIEDCAQAHGAKYRGQPVGSLGNVAAWSFCQDKIMTTGGEGGMLTTNNQNNWERAWSYKDHGKSLKAINSSDDTPGFKWVHESFGSNLRMTEMQAAIGRIQLTKMPQWHETRKTNAEKILDACSEFPNVFRTPRPGPDIEHAWYKCYVFVRPGALKANWSRDRMIIEINERGVPCFSGSCPEIYLEKAFDNTDFRPEKRLPVAKELGETSLMFLIHPTLTQEEIARTCDVIRDVALMASK